MRVHWRYLVVFNAEFDSLDLENATGSTDCSIGDTADVGDIHGRLLRQIWSASELKPRYYPDGSLLDLSGMIGQDPFATNHLWALALDGFAHSILEHTAAPISK